MKPAEIREMADDDLAARLEQLQEEIFRLRFRAATTELDNPILLRTLRRDIARIKTIQHERAKSHGGVGA